MKPLLLFDRSFPIFFMVILITSFSLQGQSISKSLGDQPYSADLGNGTYLNPILKGDYGDPSILRDGDDYYMTNHMATRSIPQLLIWHSKDLVNWQPITYSLKKDLGGAVWAVDFIKYKDLYYIYMPVPDKNTTYVITSLHPEGPWSDPVDVGVSGIDPGHVATPKGKRYLYVDNGYVVELSDDGLKAVSKKKKVYDGWQFPKDWIDECFCMESPKLTYHNDYYYLTVAQGGTTGPRTGHMVVSARSKTPIGPWENSPYNPIVRSNDRNNKWGSIGHGTLVDSPDGKWWIVFHGYEKEVRNMGRQTLLLPVEWTNDGWFNIPNGIDIAKPIKKPIGKKVENQFHLSDDFSGSKPGLQWKMSRSNINDRVHFKNNELVMEAQGESPKNSLPLLVDPTTNFYEVEIGISLSEKSRGGIVLYIDNDRYLGLELEGKTISRLTGYGNKQEIKTFDSAKEVRLKLVNDHQDLLYYYSLDKGKTWDKVDFGNYLPDLGGGTLRPGLYAAGEGEVYFSHFVYHGLKE